MAVARTGGSSGGSGSVTSINVAGQPGTLIGGEFRLGMVLAVNAADMVATPAGWTELLDVSLNTGRLAMFWKFYNSAQDDAQTYVFSSNTTNNSMASRTSNFSGVHPTNPIMVAPVTASSASTTSWPGVPSITPTENGGWIHWMIGYGLATNVATRTLTQGSAGLWTAESTPVLGGTTTQTGFQLATAYSDAGYDAGQASGTRTFTASFAALWRGAAVVLRPAPGAAIRLADQFHTMAHHEPERSTELWTPDRGLGPRRRRHF